MVVFSNVFVIFSEILQKGIPVIFKANNSTKEQNAAKALDV